MMTLRETTPGRFVPVSLPVCAHLGPPTGETRPCDVCGKGTVDVPLLACALHGVCAEDKLPKGVQCCRICPDNTAHQKAAAKPSDTPTLQVQCKSPGIGDVLCSLLVCAGLQQLHPAATVHLWTGARQADWSRLFWPHVTTQRLPAPTCFDDEALKPEFDAKRLPRWKFWAAQHGVTPRLPDPLPLPGADLDWAVAHNTAGRVVLSPFSAHADRTWSLWHWLALEKLLIERGYLLLITDDRPERIAAFTSDKLIGTSPGRMTAALRYATCFIGNDSGMAHVAGLLRVPSVVLCSAVSDHDIMACYPTAHSLRGLDTITPATVADTLGRKLRALDADFPADDFAAVLHPADRPSLDSRLPIYAALWQTVRALNPRRIVEIGSRAGYSAWTMLHACPDATIQGYDLDTDTDGGMVGAHVHAQRINPARFQLTIGNSHDLELLPECDLAYIDGDHTYPGAMLDLELAERSGAPTLLIDDVAHLWEVRNAVNDFLRAHPYRTGRFIPSMTGWFLVEGKP